MPSQSQTADTTPHFRMLDADEISAVLTRNHMGRIAYTFHDQVNIVPLHYIYDDGWIYGRTSPGEKLVTLEHHRWVAFEVDEVQGLYDWRSVVLHGGFYVLSPGDEGWERALQLLRSAIQAMLAEDDPTPFRTVLFRISVQENTGREAVSQDDNSPNRNASFT